MRIYITGVAGFIGSTLADRLIEEGHEVWGIDNLQTGREENISSDVMWFLSNIEDGLHRQGIFGKKGEFWEGEPDLIIHCAASYKDPSDWLEDAESNIVGAQVVGEYARQCNARIIYFQTVLPPISSYAISKIAGEHYLRLSGQPLTVFRLAAVYGPRNLSGAIPTFYSMVSQGKPCTVVEDATRDFVFVDDLVDLVMAQLDFEGNHVIDVRSGVETAIRLIPYLIGEAFDIEPIVNLVPRREDDVAHYEMNGAPLAGTSFSEGLDKAIDWYEQNGVGETFTHLKLGETNAS